MFKVKKELKQIFPFYKSSGWYLGMANKQINSGKDKILLAKAND